MSYELTEVAKMMKVYSTLEAEAKNFLFISSYPMKNKDHKIKTALATLRAIEEYKKLPQEIRKELEKDKASSANSITELEKLCKEAVK